MDVFEQLRKTFDGADSFVAGGHAVRGGGSTSHSQRVSRTPEWANNDAEVRSLLLKVFPKLDTSESQRKRAGAWMLIIYYYFRMGLTQNRIVLKMKWTPYRVQSLIRNIKRAASGRAGNGMLRGGKRGRPKNSAPLLATYVDTGTNGDSHTTL